MWRNLLTGDIIKFVLGINYVYSTSSICIIMKVWEIDHLNHFRTFKRIKGKKIVDKIMHLVRYYYSVWELDNMPAK